MNGCPTASRKTTDRGFQGKLEERLPQRESLVLGAFTEFSVDRNGGIYDA